MVSLYTGLTSTNFLYNGDELIVISLLCISFLIIALLMYRFQRHIMLERLRDSVRFSLIIRFLLISSCDLLLFAWLQLKYVRLT
jgi:hypothetical protein